MNFQNELSSVWLSTAETKPTWAALDRDAHADVVVIGGGITGLTAAYFLAREGKKVIVLEAGRIAEGESGRTTAHLTHVFDTWPNELTRKFNAETAKAVWDGGALAIRLVEETVRTEGIDCDFARVPGYLYTDESDDVERLHDVAEAARQLGYACHQSKPHGLTFPALAMLEFPDQARLHPVRYLMGLASCLQSRGVEICEMTQVEDISGSGPHRIVTATGHDVTCDQVIIAAHVPFNNRVTLHTKQAAYRSYAIAMRVQKGAFPDALFWDTQTPYHYMRLQPGDRYDLLIVGGEDHKTGQPQEGTTPFERLEAFARRFLRMNGEVVAQWSGQIMEPVDGLPMIGENPGAKGEYVATGFAGNGWTNGPLAAHMLTERVLGRETPWDAVFNPGRLMVHGVGKFVAENVDYPTHMVTDRLRGEEEDRPIATLHVGEGGIFKVGGRKLAVSRLDNGHIVAVSPVCTHLGCHVHFNGVERTWDCPCHGSRFSREGDVINGPAARALEAVPLEEVLAEEGAQTAPVVDPGLGTAPGLA